MTRATEVFRNRIALIFDFDSTLAPSTFHTLLSEMGIDADKFEEERVQPLKDDDWDTILARYHCLIEESKQRDEAVTLSLMEQVGKNFPLYENVDQMFGCVRDWANEVIDDIEIEFYMLTAGMVEIPQATKIASEFEQIWAGQCYFNEQGELTFIRRIITHPEKIRYLTQLAKGYHKDGSLQPEDVYRHIDEDDYYIPFDQMIYVGDGGSDMPAFSLMEDEGGIAIGVVNADEVDEWEGYEDMYASRRVQNLAVADYHPDSELMKSLKHAVHSIAEKIALRSMSENQ